MVFHLSWGGSNSPQVSWTLLSVPAVLNNAVVWVVFTRPPTSNHDWYNRHLQVLYFFQFQSKVEVLILLFTWFQFYSALSRYSKVHNFASSLFCWLLFGLVFWTRLGDQFVCQSPIGVCVYHSAGQLLGWADTICSYGHI